MRSTLLVRDILWQCSILLQDTSPQFTRWTEAELVGWLNDARRAVVKYMPWVASRLAVIKLQRGTRQSIAEFAPGQLRMLDGNTADTTIRALKLLDIVRNMGASGTQPGRSINIVDRGMLDSIDRMWHTKVGPYVRSFVYDPQVPETFYVYPGLSGPAWIEASFIERIPEIVMEATGAFGRDGASTTTVGIDDVVNDDIVNYVCARSHMKDSKYSDSGKATAFEQLFVNSLNAQVTAATGVNPNLKRLPFVGSPAGQAS